MKQALLDKVHQSAAQEGAVVLHVALCGSRAFGYAAPHSDYDVRFIYAYPLPLYFSLVPPPKELRLQDTDIVGYELGKFLAMAAGNGWNAHEMLHSPVWYESALLATSMRAVCDAVFFPAEVVAALSSAAKTYLRRLAHLENDAESADKLQKWTLGCMHHLLAAHYVCRHRKMYPIPLRELAAAVAPEVLPPIEQLVAHRAGGACLTPAEWGAALSLLRRKTEALHDQLQSAELPPPTTPGATTLPEAFYLDVVKSL